MLLFNEGMVCQDQIINKLYFKKSDKKKEFNGANISETFSEPGDLEEENLPNGDGKGLLKGDGKQNLVEIYF